MLNRLVSWSLLTSMGTSSVQRSSEDAKPAVETLPTKGRRAGACPFLGASVGCGRRGIPVVAAAAAVIVCGTPEEATVADATDGRRDCIGVIRQALAPSAVAVDVVSTPPLLLPCPLSVGVFSW